MPHPPPESTARRTGRWRTGEQNRQRVVEAARELFMERSYDQVTVRAVAAAAGVDVAMVYYFFGSKEGLFTSALALDEHPVHELVQQLDEGLPGLGARLVRSFLERWDGKQLEPLMALWSSANSHQRSREMLRETLLAPAVDRLHGEHGIPDAALRVELVVTHLMGLAFARYRIRLEPMASADHDVLVAWVGPTLQRYLADPLP